MTRREFSKAVQRAALVRAGGRFEGVVTDGSRCPCALQIGRFHYDHIIPAALTEDASLENCQVLCRPCHADKTVVDVSFIARASPARSPRRRHRPAPTAAAGQPRQPVQAADRWRSGPTRHRRASTMRSRLLFFHPTCQRGIYDHIKTAVRTIFIRRERAYRARNWLPIASM